MPLSHPTLLATRADFSRLQTLRKSDALLDAFLKRGEAKARELLSQPPSVYQKTGRRLLGVSRTVLERVLLLTFQFHLSDNREFLERAQGEMLAASAFSDWNPSHFLDVAEMTTGLALGLDWLRDDLEPGARQTIATAILEKGVLPALEENQHWLRSTNNWNSVCLGGLIMGAAALRDSDLQKQALGRVEKYNGASLDTYAPDGVYPEGPMYWAYGTMYQILIFEAQRLLQGVDEAAKWPGFLPSASALVGLQSTQGKTFNFSDGRETLGAEPAIFWFAKRLELPGLLKFQRGELEWRLPPKQNSRDLPGDRFAPLIALWWPERWEGKSLPLNWHGRGQNPVGVFRSSWDKNALFLAFKGGRANLSHGHMDAGSFVLDWGGLRWARDLGMQDYESLESIGLRLWDMGQNGQRWSVLRLNNFSHNTLTIENTLHTVGGHAEIRVFDAQNRRAELDLTPVFAPRVQSAIRIFEADARPTITDEICANPGTLVKWNMATTAQIALDGDQTATLSQGDKRLSVSVSGDEGAKFSVVEADSLRAPHDTKNTNTRFLQIETRVPASGNLRLRVGFELEGVAI